MAETLPYRIEPLIDFDEPIHIANDPRLIGRLLTVYLAPDLDTTAGPYCEAVPDAHYFDHSDLPFIAHYHDASRLLAHEHALEEAGGIQSPRYYQNFFSELAGQELMLRHVVAGKVARGRNSLHIGSSFLAGSLDTYHLFGVDTILAPQTETTSPTELISRRYYVQTG